MVEELEEKLSEYENEIIRLKESETKLIFENNELKHLNSTLKLKLEQSDFQSTQVHRRNKTQMNDFSQTALQNERLSTLGYMVNTRPQLLYETSGSDETVESPLAEECKERATYNDASPLTMKLKSAKIQHKKYIKYKTLCNDLKIQLQEMKDRAISSLVGKEKHIGKHY